MISEMESASWADVLSTSEISIHFSFGFLALFLAIPAAAMTGVIFNHSQTLRLSGRQDKL